MSSGTTIKGECVRNCFPPYAMGHFGQELTKADIIRVFINSSKKQLESWEKECSGCTSQCVIRNLANATPETVLTVLKNRSNILP